MTSKVLATIGSGPMAPVLEVAAVTFQRYAARHGYDLVIGGGGSAGRPPAWGKILLIRKLLEAYDEVLWIDSDAIVLDDSVDLAAVVPADSYQAMARPPLARGAQQRILNSGVWLLRGERAKDLLDAVWERDEWTMHPWWEQRAVVELLGFDEDGSDIGATEWRDGTTWLDDEWNTFERDTGLNGACRIRHYTFRPNSYRLARMRIDLCRLDGRPWRLADLRWRSRYIDFYPSFVAQNPLIRYVRDRRKARKNRTDAATT